MEKVPGDPRAAFPPGRHATASGWGPVRGLCQHAVCSPPPLLAAALHRIRRCGALSPVGPAACRASACSPAVGPFGRPAGSALASALSLPRRTCLLDPFGRELHSSREARGGSPLTARCPKFRSGASGGVSATGKPALVKRPWACHSAFVNSNECSITPASTLQCPARSARLHRSMNLLEPSL